jgi:hypothetical protein
MISCAKFILRMVKTYLIHTTVRSWLFIFFPLLIGISFLLSVGPAVQQYTIALLNSTASSIYATVYEDSLIKFPTLHEWLASGLYWLFVLMSAVISTAILRCRTTRELAFYTVVTSFAALVVADTILGAFQRSIDARFIFITVVSNFQGALILAFIVVAMGVAIGACNTSGPTSKAARRMVAGAIPVTMGVGISVIVYYIATIFYEPIPASFDVQVRAPISGYFNSGGLDSATRLSQKFTQKLPAFSFIPRGDSLQKVALVSSNKSLELNWSALDAAHASYEAKIEIIDSCWSPEDIRKLATGSSPIILKDIKRLSLSFDDGHAEFGLIEPGRVSVSAQGLTSFWIRTENNQKKLDITQFMDDRAALSVWGGGLSFYVTAALAKFDEEKADLTARTLQIDADSRRSRIKFQPPKGLSAKASLVCRRVPTSPLRDENTYANINGPIVGVVVHIKEQLDANVISLAARRSTLEVTGAAGWLTVGDLSTEALYGMGPQQLSMISLQGNISRLKIDGAAAETVMSDQYTASGNIIGHFDEDGGIRFSGVANNLFRNQERANPTRWERLGWESGVTLIASLLAGILWLGKTVFQSVKGNVTVEWFCS